MSTLIAPIQERGKNHGFQVQKPDEFSRVSERRKLVKHRYRPDYRKIRSYYKSPRQYQKERARRRKALALAGQGLGLAEVAKALGVSSRTVQRDLARVERYTKAQATRRRDLLEKQELKELEDVSAETLLKRFEVLTRLMRKTKKLGKEEEYEQHNTVFLINLDQLVDGLPTAKVLQHPSRIFKTPHNISVILLKNGMVHNMGGVKIFSNNVTAGSVRF